MPSGYLVTLGDGVLDAGDAITDPFVFFTTQTILGDGTWTWSGTFGGTTFTDEVEPGEYHLATDGNVYFIPDFGAVTTITSASVTTSPAYADAPTDNQIDGTGAADTIDNTYTDPDGDQVDDGSGFGSGGLGDYVLAGAGDDFVDAGAGDDLIEGGLGADSLDGGTGGDTIYGDGENAAGTVTETLDWTDQGGNGTDLSAGFTQTTGLIDVSVSFASDGNNNPTFLVSTNAQYAGPGEPFDTASSVELFGQGDADTSTTTIDFAAATAGTAEDEVTNVSFRINDIDWADGNHEDIITINAYDADGNPVTVTITPGANDDVTGNTITAEQILENPDDLGGSALIEIAGPVSQIEIIYSNGLGNTQAIYITDLYFEATPISGSDDSIRGEGGDDLLYGGVGNDTVRGGGGTDTLFGNAGADLLFGGGGNDELNIGDGDTVRGGSGDDTFRIDPDELAGGSVTVIGGEAGETDGDTLDLTGLLQKGSIVYTNTDDAAGGLSGTATLIDGTVVTFSEIETIICFTEGTAIKTPHGDRRIETLKAGDLVLTVDNGPQPIRWIGRKTVRASGDLAPIRFSKGTIGNHRDLLVSPQHRMLCGGYMTQLHFGEPEVLAPAKSLVDDFGVTVAYGGMVTYVHMLFDQHELVFANGAPSESFFPGDSGLDTLTAKSREELFAVFPELRSDVWTYGPASRVCLKAQDARALARL